MKVRVQATVYEGYSDALTGKLLDRVEVEYEMPAVPRSGDYVLTGYGDHRVATVFWSADGSVTLQLDPIYTGADSQEEAIAAFGAPPLALD